VENIFTVGNVRSVIRRKP